jgi:hypothetical protein
MVCDDFQNFRYPVGWSVSANKGTYHGIGKTMTDRNNKNFFEMMNKLAKVRETVFQRTGGYPQKGNFELYLTELYFRSFHAIELIKSIAEFKENYDSAALDKLLEDFVNLQIELYTEMFLWAKDLRHPLREAIDEAARKLHEISPNNNDCD